MKKTSKAAQLRLVRDVVRQLTPTEMQSVAGGFGGQQTCVGPSRIVCNSPTKLGCDAVSEDCQGCTKSVHA